MKKIFALLLVCALVFSLAFTMTSCFGNGDDTTDETPDETPGGDTNGDNNGDNNQDNPGIDSEGGNEIFENMQGNGGVIEMPIVDVNSKDMTQPEDGENTEGTEDGTTEENPDAE